MQYYQEKQMAELHGRERVEVRKRTSSNILLRRREILRDILQTATKHHILAGYVRDRLETLVFTDFDRKYFISFSLDFFTSFTFGNYSTIVL